MDIYLNTCPSIDGLIIYRIILNRYPTIQQPRLVIQINISDRFNDTDNELVENNNLNLISFFYYNANDQFYERTFTMSELGINTPEAVIGHALNIILKDKLQNFISMAQTSVKRNINEYVNLKTSGYAQNLRYLGPSSSDQKDHNQTILISVGLNF